MTLGREDSIPASSPAAIIIGNYAIFHSNSPCSSNLTKPFILYIKIPKNVYIKIIWIINAKNKYQFCYIVLA
jgi:hypothetical protein